MGTRREFLGNVGGGMLVASVGLGTAFDMGLTPAWAGDDGGERITFGGLEPLVSLMQETSVRKLMPVLVDKLNTGTDLKQLVAAAALANARTFGGEDYVGFHTLMALAPAYHMAGELPDDRRALPVLKVLYRIRTVSRSTAAARRKCCIRSSRACSPPGTTRGRPSATQCAGRT